MKKAEADVRTARLAASQPERDNDVICFHCQQAAEKYLKALLQEAGQPVPKIHNLLTLRGQLLPLYPSFQSFRRGLAFLTRFAVESRYPGFPVSRRQADACLRWADLVRDKCREFLNI